MIATGRWVVVGLVGPDGPVHLVEGSHLTLEVSAEGDVAGFGGCNRFFGRVGEDGRLGVMGRTMMAGPPELMTQEDLFLDLLGKADEIVDRGHAAEMRAGGKRLVLLAAIDEDIRRVPWALRGIHDGGSGFSSVLGDVVITALFDNEGRLSGHSGCNRYSASYSTDSNGISIGAAAGTRMMCPDPVVMEQEGRYLDWLARATTYRVSVGREGRTLELLDSEGLRILEFVEEV